MKHAWSLFAVVIAVPCLGTAEPAKVVKNDFVREKPFTNGKVIVSIKAGQSVDIQKRQSSWYLVKANAKTGWTPMLSVRRTQAGAPATAGSLSSTATGRSATGGVVSTTGVRGLNEATLATAQFDSSAVAAAEKHRTTPAEVDSFAQAGGIQVQTVPPLSSTDVTGGAK